MLSLSLENPQISNIQFPQNSTQVDINHLEKIIKKKRPKRNQNRNSTLNNSSNHSNSTKSSSFEIDKSQPSTPTIKNSLDTTISNLPQFHNLSSTTLNSIYKQIIREETSYQSKLKNCTFISNQLDITEMHRAILLDWLVNIISYLKLSDECLFLTAKIIDSFLLSESKFPKNQLQLLGISSLLLASKYIDTTQPLIEDLCVLCDYSFTKREVLNFERRILKNLDYTIPQDNLLNFYDMLALIFNFTLREYYLGKFLLEISLLEILMYKYNRALLAFSVVYLVMKINIQKHHDYKKCFLYLRDKESNEVQIKSCGRKILDLYDNIKKSNKYTSSLQKYRLQIQESDEDEDVEMTFN